MVVEVQIVMAILTFAVLKMFGICLTEILFTVLKHR